MDTKERASIQKYLLQPDNEELGAVIVDDIREDWFPQNCEILVLAMSCIGGGFMEEMYDLFGYEFFNADPVDKGVIGVTFVIPLCKKCGGPLNDMEFR